MRKMDKDSCLQLAQSMYNGGMTTNKMIARDFYGKRHEVLGQTGTTLYCTDGAILHTTKCTVVRLAR